MTAEAAIRPLFRATRGGPRLTDEQRVERTRVAHEALEAAGGDRGVAAAALGIRPQTLRDIVARRDRRGPDTDAAPLGAQLRSASYAIAPGPPDIGGWRAACMEPAEWDAWTSANRGVTDRADRAALPCADCLPGFAAEMRKADPEHGEGRCNGSPHGAKEDTEMDTPKIATVLEPEPFKTVLLGPLETLRLGSPRRIALDVAAPPCESCVHEPICSLRVALEGLVDVETTAPALPAGFSFTLMAVVACGHFLRDRAKAAAVRVLTSEQRGQANKPKRAGHEVTEETREKMRQAALATSARKREGAAAG